jgi:hypothetical protein
MVLVGWVKQRNACLRKHECLTTAAGESVGESKGSLLGFLGLNGSLLVAVWLGEVEVDLVGGHGLEDVGHGVELLFNFIFVEWVEQDFDVLFTVEGNSGGSSNNGGWNTDVVKESILNVLEGSRSWSHLGWVVLG